MLTLDQIHSITKDWGTISGGIFYSLLVPFNFFCQRKALNEIKKALNKDEVIVFIPKLQVLGTIFFPFILGAAIGRIILPVIIFNIYIDRYVNQYTMPLWIIGDTISICGVLLLCCFKAVITNQRIMRRWAFSSLEKVLFDKKIIKYFDTCFSDISSLEFKNNLISPSLIIQLKNNSTHVIGGFRNIKKIKSEIEKYWVN